MADEAKDKQDEAVEYDHPELGLTGTPLDTHPDGTVPVAQASEPQRTKVKYEPFRW